MVEFAAVVVVNHIVNHVESHAVGLVNEAFQGVGSVHPFAVFIYEAVIVGLGEGVGADVAPIAGSLV